MRTTILFLMAAHGLMAASAAPLVTLQNSTVSIPAETIASTELPGATNLVGSSLMLSAVAPATLQGGRASLVNSPQWVRRYNGDPTSSYNAAYAMAVRADGNIIVTGLSLEPRTNYDFAATSYDYEFVTISYTADGTPLWTNRYDGPEHGSDTARMLAVNASGEVWVAGDSMRYLTNSTLTDVVLIKYASNGVPAWTNRYSSFETNGAYPTALLVDESGNAYVQLWASYWSGSSGTPVEDVLIKYDTLGNVVWIKSYSHSAPDSGQGLHNLGPMALDEEGNLFIAGRSGSRNMNTGSSIVKFTSDGTPVWTNHHPFGFVFSVSSLSVDRQGNPIAAGDRYRWGDGAWDYVAIKCSKDGASLWTNMLTGPAYSGGNVPQTAIDVAGHVFLIGDSPGTRPGFYRIVKVNSDGVPLWTNQTAGFGITNSMITGSAVDSAGNVYLTGYAPGPDSTYRDYVTIKYSGHGQPLWTNRFDGWAGLDDFPSALAVDGAGNVYVAGQSESQAGGREFATVKYADSLFYSPPKDFTGSDTITYTVTDSRGNHATASVEVLVVPGSFQFDVSPATMNLTPSGLELLIDGVPGTNEVVLEASLDQVSWLRILTNAPGNGSVQFRDPAATIFPRRFYRALQQQ